MLSSRASDVRRETRDPYSVSLRGYGLWVPAFAGTTAMLVVIVSSPQRHPPESPIGLRVVGVRDHELLLAHAAHIHGAVLPLGRGVRGLWKQEDRRARRAVRRGDHGARRVGRQRHAAHRVGASLRELFERRDDLEGVFLLRREHERGHGVHPFVARMRLRFELLAIEMKTENRPRPDRVDGFQLYKTLP